MTDTYDRALRLPSDETADGLSFAEARSDQGGHDGDGDADHDQGDDHEEHDGRDDDPQRYGREPKDDKEDDDGKDKKKSKLPIIILAVVLVVIVIGGLIWWFAHRDLESTDDAYTEGNAVSIAPKVPGYVQVNRINDNVFVHAGDLLLKIDPRDYVAARDQAQANLDAALAQEGSAENDLRIARVRAPADLEQAQAQLLQASASRDKAANDFARQKAVDPRATTQTTVDETSTALRQGEANVKAAHAQVAIASLVRQNIATAEAAVKQKEAQVEQARAQLAKAELDLSYTEVRAPVDGLVTKRNVDAGAYLQAGQQVFYLVPHDLWVTANFKETQLKRMRIGQRVDIKIDAYPQLDLSGKIQSIQGGAGARFTAFPAENATGNFVKIVRRVPVKILIDRGLPRDQTLPLGLSVEPTVHLQ